MEKVLSGKNNYIISISISLLFLFLAIFGGKSLDSLLLMEKLHPYYFDNFNLATGITWEEDGYKRQVYYVDDINKLRASDLVLLKNELRYIRSGRYDQCAINLFDGNGIFFTGDRLNEVTYSEIDSDGLPLGDQYPVRINKDGFSLNNGQRISQNTERLKERLCDIDDIYVYLSTINDERYYVFVSLTDDIRGSFTQLFSKDIRALGIKSPIRYYHGWSFAAAICPGMSIEEDYSLERITLEGKMDDGVTYSVTSGGKIKGNSFSSIIINGTEYSLNKRGLNYVVFDRAAGCVADSMVYNRAVSPVIQRD